MCDKGRDCSQESWKHANKRDKIIKKKGKFAPETKCLEGTKGSGDWGRMERDRGAALGRQCLSGRGLLGTARKGEQPEREDSERSGLQVAVSSKEMGLDEITGGI